MLAILIVISIIFLPAARSTVWYSIPLALLFVGLVAGVSLIVACANVLFRDIEHILTAALLPWFFVTPILWSFASVGSHLQGHHKLADVLRWGNFVAPPVFAIRDSLWLGHAPRPADVIYLAVAAVVSLTLGAFVFTRVDDRIAVEL
jgi:ABC-type polysaccharide/polyol phosphate export permease